MKVYIYTLTDPSYGIGITLLVLIEGFACGMVLIAETDRDYWWVGTPRRALLFRAIWLLVLLIVQGILIKL